VSATYEVSPRGMVPLYVPMVLEATVVTVMLLPMCHALKVILCLQLVQ
jgi:hypothetical protein